MKLNKTCFIFNCSVSIYVQVNKEKVGLIWLFIFWFAELREETVEVLLSTSSLLQLNSVTNACCAFLKKQLDPCNCLGIALFAEQQSCLDLHKSALKYTYQNFMQVNILLFYFFLYFLFFVTIYLQKCLKCMCNIMFQWYEK